MVFINHKVKLMVQVNFLGYLLLCLTAFFSIYLYGDESRLPNNWNDFRRKDCEQNSISNERVEERQVIRIIGVIDGDSLCGEDMEGFQYHIRMDGIDAPEFRQSHYEEAKQFLAEQVWQQDVCLVVKETDRYGRFIGKIYLTDGETCSFEQSSVNLTMVREGWAWMYHYFFKQAPHFSKSDFEEAEKIARRDKVGLWSNPHAQNPYECRKNKKQKKRCR